MNAEQAARVSHDMGLLAEACALTVKGSTITEKSIQRRLRVGFAKAGRLMHLMEDIGVVGPYCGLLPRDVLVAAEDLPRILDIIRGAGGGGGDDDNVVQLGRKGKAALGGGAGGSGGEDDYDPLDSTRIASVVSATESGNAADVAE